MFDTIKAQASGIFLGVTFVSGFAAGFVLERYLAAVKLERVEALHRQEQIARQNAVIKAQNDLLESKRLAEVQHANAVNAINTIMDNQRVQFVPIERICSGGLPEATNPDSPARSVLREYDSGLAEVYRVTIEAVQSCELDREGVIRQAGGR